MKQLRFSSIREMVRADDWLYYKIPPLLAFGYAMALVGGIPFVAFVKTMSILLLSICSVAAYGYVINDMFDIEQDRAAGKKNAMAAVRPLYRCGISLFFLASGFLPLLLLEMKRVFILLLAVNYLLPTFYSLPWVRFKERGFLGVAADALGAHTVPALLVLLAFLAVPDGSIPGRLGVLLLISGLLWTTLLGLRGILIHQIRDSESDKQAHVVTFVSKRQHGRVRNVVLKVLLPCEVLGFVSFICLLLPFSPILLVVFLIYIPCELAKMALGWKLSPFVPKHDREERHLPFLNNEFYEVWLPCALSAQLFFENMAYGIVFLLHLLLFRPLIMERLSQTDGFVRQLKQTLLVWWSSKVRVEYIRFRKYVHRMKAAGTSLPAIVAGLFKQVRGDLPEGLRGVRIIVASPAWTSNGVNAWSAALVRALRSRGMRAHILVTEEETDLVQISEERIERPLDVPFEILPVERGASWGAHWGAMIRYLEERSPCIYIPNYDWRHSCVVPLLSDQVAVVGTVYEDDPLYMDHLRRLGVYWDAIVVPNETVARRVLDMDGTFDLRIEIISAARKIMELDYLRLFSQLFDASYRCVYRRPRGVMSHPPFDVNGIELFPVELRHEVQGIGRFPTSDRDYREFMEEIGRKLPTEEPDVR